MDPQACEVITLFFVILAISASLAFFRQWPSLVQHDKQSPSTTLNWKSTGHIPRPKEIGHAQYSKNSTPEPEPAQHILRACPVCNTNIPHLVKVLFHPRNWEHMVNMAPWAATSFLFPQELPHSSRSPKEFQHFFSPCGIWGLGLRHQEQFWFLQFITSFPVSPLSRFLMACRWNQDWEAMGWAWTMDLWRLPSCSVVLHTVRSRNVQF